MAISSDTWAIVAATAVGPIAAVAVTFVREHLRSKRDRRLHVFRTLMATRKLAISQEHVGAINLIEVEFYGKKNVESAWVDYKTHLNDTARPEDAAWREKKEKLLAKLLSEIGQVLGFKYDTLDIFQGGYAPGGWAHRDMRAVGALEFLNDLAECKKAIPIWIAGPQSAQQPASPEPPSNSQADKLMVTGNDR